MKYPLEPQQWLELINHLAEHDKALRAQILKVPEPPPIFIEDTGEVGGELSEAELSRAFGEKSANKTPGEKTLKEMTISEIDSTPLPKLEKLVKKAEDDEAAEELSNDIYRIKARVANLARGPGVSLTPQGEMLCNTYVHVLKALYDFADTIKDDDIRLKLKNKIRDQEGMPGNLIAAAGAGVTQKKK